jgi:hypothetical protein
MTYFDSQSRRTLPVAATITASLHTVKLTVSTHMCNTYQLELTLHSLYTAAQFLHLHGVNLSLLCPLYSHSKYSCAIYLQGSLRGHIFY